MFDLRYHIASLAAVFVALAVGIVIGVAIVSSDDVSRATEAVTKQKIGALEKQLEAANHRANDTAEAKQAVDALMDEAYPALMAERCLDKSFGIVFLGEIDPAVRNEIEETLADAGSGEPPRVVALELPVDPDALAQTLADDPLLAAYAGDGRLGDLGEALGRELVEGAEGGTWDTLSSDLVSQRTGSIADPVDGVVVVRRWVPEESTDPDAISAAQSSEQLVDGLLAGMSGTGAAVVGVEATDADPTAVPFFRERGVSTVNDVEALAGHVALATVLCGGEPGNYGVGDGAPDGVVPPIEPVETLTVAAESTSPSSSRPATRPAGSGRSSDASGRSSPVRGWWSATTARATVPQMPRFGPVRPWSGAPASARARR